MTTTSGGGAVAPGGPLSVLDEDVWTYGSFSTPVEGKVHVPLILPVV